MPPEKTALAPIPSLADAAVCRDLLARGSRSFSLAAWLLPRRIRPSVTAFYAFCRAADDLVDDSGEPDRAVRDLRFRLDRIFATQPMDDPIDRAMAHAVAQHRLSRAPFDALIEGFVWDVDGRRYDSLSEVLDYAARVASTVGVVMTQIMGVHDRATLARACDLGAAMQLTNICRDVGEDARRGRVYLPRRWLMEHGVDAAALVRDPGFSPGLGRVVARTLDAADDLYDKATAGIERLPPDCRAAIRAAAAIYRDIGRVIRKRGCDAVSDRARVGGPRKLWLLARSYLAGPPRNHRGMQPALPQAEFLLE